MAAAAEPRPAAPATHGMGGAWLALGAVAASGATLAYLVFVVGDEIDVATLFLSAAAAVLVLGLRGMFAVVQALAQPGSEGPRIVEDDLAKSATELREDKKRILSAIKELDFDYELGKLSKEDYEAVSENYRLRAVEVLRRLEGSGSLHPELQRIVDDLSMHGDQLAPDAEGDLGPVVDDASPGAAVSEVVPECRACGGGNDVDAKFCKHCGEAIGS